MYNNANELKIICKERKKPLCVVAIEIESEVNGCSIDEIRSRFKNMIDIMRNACFQTLNNTVPSISGLTGGDAKLLYEYAQKSGSILSGDILNGVAYALSCFEVNTSMGKIVAAPTAGSCGILPASLLVVAKQINASEDLLIDAFATAAAVGSIIEQNATLSGAEGGCQAECGSASAMAAAAVVEMKGGSVEQSFDAAAMTLKNVMGLVCDPIAGLVEVPCAKRNAIGVVNALLCADLALAGIKSFVPFDEVVSAMYSVGKSIPCELRETGIGGLAGTPTGTCVRKKVFNS